MRAKGFWGKFLVRNAEIKLHCLEKSWHCKVRSFWMIMENYILCRGVSSRSYSKNVFFNRKWLWQYYVLCFHICRLWTVLNKQVLKNQTFFLPWNVLLWQLGNLWGSCRNPLFYNIFHWNHFRPLNNTTFFWNISESYNWNFLNRIGDWTDFLT